jgi:hypothetical protein
MLDVATNSMPFTAEKNEMLKKILLSLATIYIIIH